MLSRVLFWLSILFVAKVQGSKCVDQWKVVTNCTVQEDMDTTETLLLLEMAKNAFTVSCISNPKCEEEVHNLTESKRFCMGQLRDLQGKYEEDFTACYAKGNQRVRRSASSEAAAKEKGFDFNFRLTPSCYPADDKERECLRESDASVDEISGREVYFRDMMSQKKQECLEKNAYDDECAASTALCMCNCLMVQQKQNDFLTCLAAEGLPVAKVTIRVECQSLCTPAHSSNEEE